MMVFVVGDFVSYEWKRSGNFIEGFGRRHLSKGPSIISPEVMEGGDKEDSWEHEEEDH